MVRINAYYAAREHSIAAPTFCISKIAELVPRDLPTKLFLQLYPRTHSLKFDFPLHDPPRPKQHYEADVEKVKDQSTAKYDRVKCPSIGLRHLHFCDDDRPRQHPQEIRTQRLIEIPARDGSKENGSELVVHRVEYVAPVDILRALVRYVTGARMYRRSHLLATWSG